LNFDIKRKKSTNAHLRRRERSKGKVGRQLIRGVSGVVFCEQVDLAKKAQTCRSWDPHHGRENLFVPRETWEKREEDFKYPPF